MNNLENILSYNIFINDNIFAININKYKNIFK